MSDTDYKDFTDTLKKNQGVAYTIVYDDVNVYREVVRFALENGAVEGIDQVTLKMEFLLTSTLDIHDSLEDIATRKRTFPNVARGAGLVTELSGIVWYFEKDLSMRLLFGNTGISFGSQIPPDVGEAVNARNARLGLESPAPSQTGTPRCPECGRKFTPRRKDQIYDSPKCERRVNDRRRKKKVAEDIR